MIKVPQTTSNEAAEAVNALIRESDRFRDWNAVEVQVLVRTMQKLQKVNATEAFIRLGSLSAITGDVDGVRDYYKKALYLSGAAEMKREFWASLGNIGLYSEAREIGSSLLDPKKGFFSKIWRLAVSMGQVLEVWDRLPEARKIYPDLAEVDFSPVERAVAVMQGRGLTDQAIVSVLDLMGETQRAHRIMFSGTLVSNLKVMCPPEDPAYLYLTMPLGASIDEVHAMNRELTGLVVRRLPEGAFPQGIVAAFAKAHPIELRAAA
jgi:hypothetical protein